MRPVRSFIAMCALVAAALAVKLGCVTITSGDYSDARFTQTRSVPLSPEPVTHLSLDTRNGSITVRSAPTVSLTAHIRAQSQDRLDHTSIRTERKPDGSLAISVLWPGERPLNSEGCSFELALPAVASVDADTSNGAITLASLAGPAKLHSSNGSITVSDHRGPVSARTSNGAINCSNISAPVDAHTSNGSVTCSNISADAEAHTTNGRIQMTGIAGRAIAHTSNGSVALALAPTSQGPIDVQSSNGSLDLTLSPAFAGVLSLSTSNGALRYTTSPAVRQVSADKHSARLSIGPSDTSSTAHTSNASIDLRFAQ